jgi:hypothetical protein
MALVVLSAGRGRRVAFTRPYFAVVSDVAASGHTTVVVTTR